MNLFQRPATFLLSLCLLLILVSNACSAIITWTGGTGSWTDATKWSTGAVPTPSDGVEISGYGTEVFVSPSSNITVFSLSLGDRSASTKRFSQDPTCVLWSVLKVDSQAVLRVTTVLTITTTGLLQMTNSTIITPLVDSSGILAGNGIVRGNLNSMNGGILMPQYFQFSINGTGSVVTDEDFVGHITIDGTYTQSMAVMVIDVGSDTWFDRVTVTQHIVLAGNDTLGVRLFDGFQPTELRITFLSFNEISGNFYFVASGNFTDAVSCQGYIQPEPGGEGEGTSGSSSALPDTSGRPDPIQNCAEPSRTDMSVLLGSKTCPSCPIGYYGPDCSANCPGEPDCSNQGTCLGIPPNPPECHCNEGWKGSSCSQYDCPGEPDCNLKGPCVYSSLLGRPICQCPLGWTGPDCSIGYCANNCSNNGDCITTVATPTCDCDMGWTGPDCSQGDIGCPGDPDCSLHGVCDNDTRTCDCDGDWTGNACNIAICPGGDCNSRGTCITDVSPHTCDCYDGWAGDACETGECPRSCSEHGECDTSSLVPFCVCELGWTGDDCSQREQGYEVGSDGDSEQQTVIIASAAAAGGVTLIGATVAVVLYVRRKKEDQRIDSVLEMSTAIENS